MALPTHTAPPPVPWSWVTSTQLGNHSLQRDFEVVRDQLSRVRLPNHLKVFDSDSAWYQEELSDCLDSTFQMCLLLRNCFETVSCHTEQEFSEHYWAGLWYPVPHLACWNKFSTRKILQAGCQNQFRPGHEQILWLLGSQFNCIYHAFTFDVLLSSVQPWLGTPASLVATIQLIQGSRARIQFSWWTSTTTYKCVPISGKLWIPRPSGGLFTLFFA